MLFNLSAKWATFFMMTVLYSNLVPFCGLSENNKEGLAESFFKISNYSKKNSITFIKKCFKKPTLICLQN